MSKPKSLHELRDWEYKAYCANRSGQTHFANRIQPPSQTVETSNKMPKLLSAKQCPSSAEPGTVFFNTVTKETFIALADGRFFNLAGLLSCQPVAVVGPKGERGPAGTPGRDSQVPGPAGRDGKDSTVPGPQGPIGPRGTAGSHGQNGKDSTVPGPAGKDGQSIVGPAGPKGDKGEPGSVIYPTDSQLAAANKELLQQRARVQAAFFKQCWIPARNAAATC